MEIKTKLNKDDDIWYVNTFGRITHSMVSEVQIRIFSPTPIVKYFTDCADWVLEEAAFATKEELKDYILNHV